MSWPIRSKSSTLKTSRSELEEMAGKVVEVVEVDEADEVVEVVEVVEVDEAAEVEVSDEIKYRSVVWTIQSCLTLNPKHTEIFNSGLIF
jgi:predicted neutral ceramidase superfamily lipid hydrolase